jgi:hypothetical protein
VLSSDGAESLCHRHRPVGRVLHGTSQELGRQVVVTFGDAERDFTGGAAVQLGRPAGPRTTAPEWAAVLELEQTELCQLFEVERSHRSRYPQRLGDAVAAHGRSLRSHVAIDATTRRLVQGGESCESVIRVLHKPILTHMKVDITISVRAGSFKDRR